MGIFSRLRAKESKQKGEFEDFYEQNTNPGTRVNANSRKVPFLNHLHNLSISYSLFHLILGGDGG